ncbi:hypothetical protein BM526_19820 (plasmid) [Alteromonas mediterranea]|uniref:hypothetical protein n=1 Tax=Alteromonas mediterranea TaxID=314275 RepID=UPI0009034382|nr:hypothetical protein [Alteromonas mediterranea]APE04220.1 hypothetical protein BM526_19820 [Alteromonas mediterranea]
MISPEKIVKHLILSSEDIDFEEFKELDIELLGAGGWGYAFHYNDKVFKVTTSITEAIYALQIKDKSLPSSVDIFDISLYEDPFHLYFVIEQEKVLNSEEDSRISAALNYLDDIGGDINDFDEIEERIEEGLIIEPSILKTLREISDITNELYLYGFYDADIHAGNLGISRKDGIEQVVFFDQMNTTLEDQYGDEYLNSRDIISILMENVSEESMSALSFIREADVTLSDAMPDLIDFMEDMKYAFSTVEAYEFLENGDWCAGGCRAFAKVLRNELTEYLSKDGVVDKYALKPVIGGIKNYSTSNIEHYFVKLGDFCFDATGIYNSRNFINSFVQQEAPHLNSSPLSFVKIPEDEIVKADHVNDVELEKKLKEIGLLPSSYYHNNPVPT